MSLIIDYLEIFEMVIEYGFRFAFDDQFRRRERLAAELQPRLFHMIQIDVAISPGPDEFAGVQIALLGEAAGAADDLLFTLQDHSAGAVIARFRRR